MKLGGEKKKKNQQHLFEWWIPKNREVLKVSLILHLPLTGDSSPNSIANWNPSRVPCSQGAERSKESFQERWANWHLWNFDAGKKKKKRITQQGKQVSSLSPWKKVWLHRSRKSLPEAPQIMDRLREDRNTCDWTTLKEVGDLIQAEMKVHLRDW